MERVLVMVSLVIGVGSIGLASGCCFGGPGSAPRSEQPVPGAPAPSQPMPSQPMPSQPVPEPPMPPQGMPAAHAVPAPPPAPPASPEQLAADDIAPVVEHCLNPYATSVQRSAERYFSWAARERGPRGRLVYGTYEIAAERVAGCRAAVVQTTEHAPVMPEIDAAAARYATALEAVVPLVNEASSYYHREDYRDDRMERGRAMHAPLVAAFDEFEAARVELSHHVGAIEDAARAMRLSVLAADPTRRGEYLIERTMQQANAVVELTATVRLERGRLVSDRHDELFAAITALRTGADEMHGERGTFATFSDEEQVMEAGDALAGTAVSMMRRIRDGDRLSSFDAENVGTSAGWMVDGGPDRVVRDYNRLIDIYNRR